MGEGECIRRLMIRCLVVVVGVGSGALAGGRRRGRGTIPWGREMGRHGEEWGDFLGEEEAVGGWGDRLVEGLGGISYEPGMGVCRGEWHE